MIEKIKQKAAEKKALLDADPNADKDDVKIINEVTSFLKNVDDFNRITKGTVYNMFTFLGFSLDTDDYAQMYDELMEEVNQTYVYINPDDLIRR